MRTIILSPYSQKLRNGKNNPKNYPYWQKVIDEINKIGGYNIIQIGVEGEAKFKGCEHKFNLTMKELKDLTLSAYTFLSVDNFYPHFCNTLGKYGIVVWGKSDPEIFGYKQNNNILKNRKFLRKNQFDIWEAEEFDAKVFDHFSFKDVCTKKKNLIYIIANKAYKNFAEMCVNSIKKHNDIDICCICPEGFTLPDVKMFNIPDFDWRYTSKYIIKSWSEQRNYENFLYVDTDVICNSNLDEIFDIIESNRNVIHGVMEIKSINTSPIYHKFSSYDYPPWQIGFNAGTFGFNRNILDRFDDFIGFIKYHQHMATGFDQPLFNEYFIQNNCIIPSLSPYVKLIDPKYEDINPVGEAKLNHFLGIVGNIDIKTDMIKYYMNTREEMLDKIPKGGICAEIGVFQGEFSKKIIEIVQPSKMYLVDIFTGIMHSGDKNGNNVQIINLDETYEALKKEYADSKTVEVCKAHSQQFLHAIPDNYLDFVYIDADHTYGGVKQDLEVAMKKVKAGGYIAGHDYSNKFDGVVKAVDEFCTNNNILKFLTVSDGLNSYLFKVNSQIDTTETTNTELCNLFYKYGADKCPQIYHSYSPEYDHLLRPFKETFKNVLEIGIGSRELMVPIVGERYEAGASLKAWRDYFPNANIFGADIRRDILFKEDRINCFYTDQSNKQCLLDTVQEIMKAYSDNSMQFDLIIDDGSHIIEHMDTTINALFDFITTDGIYIVEDIQKVDINRFIANKPQNSEILYVHEGETFWDGFIAYKRIKK